VGTKPPERPSRGTLPWRRGKGSKPAPRSRTNPNTTAGVSEQIVAAQKQAAATVAAAKMTGQAAILGAVITGVLGAGGATTVAAIEAAADDDSPPSLRLGPRGLPG
jgi:hypothetical protein